mgnify:CR=1 FL=1|tara:strand:+ start:493 stop:687 length:195 start_codon:yes stop_codon:yes gene_type:complete
MLGAATLASHFADAMVEKGVYHWLFLSRRAQRQGSRTQISAAYTEEGLTFVIEKLSEVKAESGI